ncbi:Hypothetical protein (plasmid) [Pseudomonas putida]|nr:Hypothetical protein [Pseudomonas putida]
MYWDDQQPWYSIMTAAPVETVCNDERIFAIRRSMLKIAEFCSRQRVEPRDEKLAQAQMEALLTGSGFTLKREHRLSSDDIPDFLINEGGFSIVLEMKTRAQRMKIYRQLERYSKHESIDGILLVSGTAMALPSMIGSKPALFASLGRGWLR